MMFNHMYVHSICSVKPEGDCSSEYPAGLIIEKNVKKNTEE
jgi:hypothetical protein